MEHENLESANFVTHKKGQGKKGKGADGRHLKKKEKWSFKRHDRKDACFFCKKKGHQKKDYLKYKQWLEKKGNIDVLVCYESNFIDTHYNTWLIDSGTTVHVANIMQGFLSLRKLTGSKQDIYSGNGMCSHVEAMGTFRLVLENGFQLDLENTFYIHSFSRNLVSISRLGTFEISISFC